MYSMVVTFRKNINWSSKIFIPFHLKLYSLTKHACVFVLLVQINPIALLLSLRAINRIRFSSVLSHPCFSQEPCLRNSTWAILSSLFRFRFDPNPCYCCCSFPISLYLSFVHSFCSFAYYLLYKLHSVYVLSIDEKRFFVQMF